MQQSPKLVRRVLFVTCVSLLAMLLFSACGPDPQLTSRADQSRVGLDKAILHAQSIGVPQSLLQPILQQSSLLSKTQAPFSLIASQQATDYYTNLAQRYQMLQVQVRGLEVQATQQLDYQATLDLQTFASSLAKRQSQGFANTKAFADQLAHNQDLMAQAQYPKHYLAVSANAKNSIQALSLMGLAYDKLTALHQNIAQMQASHLDVTALKQQEQLDQQLLKTAIQPSDYSRIIDLLDTQIQTSTTLSTQAIPYVGAAKLNQYSSYISEMKMYGIDVANYQKRLDTDKSSLDNAKTLNDFLKIAAKIDSDIAAIQLPRLRGKANYLLNQFHQEVNNWGNTHQYLDKYNGVSYKLDYEYDQQGIGSDADVFVQYAQTADDYQAAIDLINNNMLHLKAMEADYNDKTPWSQSHDTDIQLMQHYGVTKDQVIVISLIEQSLRLYQNGKVVKSFQITTGQYDKPSLPGYWHIFQRESPTKFKSSEPKGSAFWYPDTNINFAMEYHEGGYFLHDSWWRADYGPGTNFPHVDSGGDQSFAGNGSHGCINIREDLAGWLYNATGYGTAVIIY